MDGVGLLRFVSPIGKSRDYLRRSHVQHPLVTATLWLQGIHPRAKCPNL